MDARSVLEEYNGVFLNQGCLFVSTMDLFLTGYVNCEVLYPYDYPIRDLTAQLIAPFMDEVEGFICPSTGDIVLLREATRQANDAGRETTAVWADKQIDNSYRIERNGYAPAIKGRRVVVLNDRISQGGTTRKIIAIARGLDCEVLGVATLAGVSAATAESLDVPVLNALSVIDVDVFPFDEVPPEWTGLPVAADEPLGHGQKFQGEYPNYPGGFVHLLS